jgi:hypothetical protein
MRGPGAIALEKALEDVRQVLRGNPRPFVLDDRRIPTGLRWLIRATVPPPSLYSIAFR